MANWNRKRVLVLVLYALIHIASLFQTRCARQDKPGRDVRFPACAWKDDEMTRWTGKREKETETETKKTGEMDTRREGKNRRKEAK